MKSDKTILWFRRWLYFLLAHMPIKIFANIILFTAIFSLMIQGGLYYAEQNPQKTQALIADYLLIDVTFSAMSSDFNLLNPAVELDNLTIHNRFSHSPWLSFQSATISINLLKSLVSLQPKLNYFSLDGLKTSVKRDRQGNIWLGNTLLNPLPVEENKSQLHAEEHQANSSVDAVIWLLSQKVIALTDSEIQLTDELTGIDKFHLKEMNIVLRNSLWQHQLNIHLSNPKEFDELSLMMQFEGSIHRFDDWRGDFYVAINGLNIQPEPDRLLYQIYQRFLDKQQYTLQSAELNSQIWGKIEQGQLKSISGQINDSQVLINDPQQQPYLELDNFASQFSLLNQTIRVDQQPSREYDPVWRFLLQDVSLGIDQQTMNIGNIQVDIERLTKSKKNASNGDSPSPVILHSYIDRVQLQQLRPLLQHLFPAQQPVLQGLDFKGSIEQFHLNLFIRNKILSELKLNGQIVDYEQSAWQEIPFLKGLSADFWINFQLQDQYWKSNGIMNLSSADLNLKLHSLFRDEWHFDQFSTQLSWQPIGEFTWLNAEQVQVANNHLNVNGDVQFWLEEKQSPIMIIDALFHDVNAAYTSHYLPVTIMQPELVKWLDQGIISGDVPDGGVLYRGRLSDFPYPDASGNMDIVFNAERVKLNYQKGWPVVTDIRARTTFTERGMWIESDHAHVLGATSSATQVTLEDYFSGILKIDSKIKGTATQGLAFLRQSQILSESHIDSLASQGKIDIDLKLTIPTDSKSDEILSHLVIDLQRVSYLPEWLKPTEIKDIKGQLVIENGFINAKKLQGKLNEETVAIKIKTEPEQKERDAITQLEVDTQVSIPTLLGSGFIPDWLKPAFPYLAGQTGLHINLLIPNNQEIFPQVVVISDLVGIESQLPKPFNKSKKQKLPFQLSYHEESQNSQFRAQLGKMMNVTSELVKDEQQKKLSMKRLGISFGHKSAPLPRKAGIVIQGDLDLSELSKWEQLAEEIKKDPAKKSESQKPSQQTVDFDMPIKFTMDRVKFPSWQTDSTEQQAKQENKSETQESQPKSKASSKTLVAKKLPAIKGYINDLSIGDEHLGKVTFVTRQDNKDYFIEKLQLKGEQLDLDLTGVWSKGAEKPMTQVDGSIQTEDIGALMKQLGFDAIAEKSEVKFNGYLKWHGSPLAFDYQKLFGKVTLEMGAGNFSQIDPGVGRMLGLFNLSKITKRISLDFSDVSAKGFSFEDISADLLFNEGTLYTRDLSINSSIAQINIDGHLDLVEHEFDQVVTIIPNISSGLTLAGAAIAGPVGAAAGWLGHALVGKQVNKISQYQHEVSGPWAEPNISPVKTTFVEQNEVEQNEDGL